jgi:ABC-type lipoprotein export system ATPase subunit
MINIQKVSKTYNKHRRNQNVVLQETTLQLPDNGFVFFVGRSGTGKSTMLNAIGGLISYEGEILFDKQNVNIEQYRRRNIGYIFQNFLIFEELSVYDNIRIALNLIGIYDEDEIHSRTKILLEAVDLEINPSRRAGALSLGQRQRVAIARSLASNPKIILADEPTGNLDSKNSIVIMDILKKLSLDHLVICVTHNLGIVNKYADQTFMIENKQLINLDKASSENISSSTIAQNINVADMQLSEYKDENFLIKLYSQSLKSSDENNEIQIIRRNGKILVVGNNISIASKNEISLNTKAEDIEKDSVQKRDFNLNFEERIDKKKFKDSSLYKIIHKKITTKPTFKTSMNSLSNIVFPFVLFILFNLLIGQITTLKESNVTPMHENAVFVLNKDSSDTSYDSSKYLDLLNDEDSGLVDYLSINPYATTEDAAINTDLEAYITDFSLTNDIISDTNFSSSDSVGYIVKDFDDYNGLIFDDSFASLENNQVYITTKLKDQIYETLDNPSFAYQKTYSEVLIDSEISISYPNYDNSTTREKLEIKGVVDSDLPALFANTQTAEKINLFNLNTRYSLESIFSDYAFVNYELIKDDPNYVFYNISDESFSTPGEITTNEVQSYCYVSSTLYSDLNSANYLSLGYDNNYYVENLLYPDQDIVCFRDYSTTEDGTPIDSSSIFINNFISVYINQSYLQLPFDNVSLTSGTLPTQMYEVVLPESYKDFGSINLDDTDFVITGYYDDSLILDKTILASEKYIESLYMPDFDSYYYTNLGNLIETYEAEILLTSDYDKSYAYFENNTSLGLTLIKYDDVFDAYNPTGIVDSIISSAVAIGVLSCIFLAIIILSNFSYVNKEKYRFGVLRCLGYSKKELLEQNTSLVISESLLNAIIPCLVFTVLLLAFDVYNLGIWWTLLFYLSYVLIMALTSNFPLFILLRKKPVDIIGSLN